MTKYYYRNKDGELAAELSTSASGCHFCMEFQHQPAAVGRLGISSVLLRHVI